MTEPYRVMTVCTGNICRSPMAQVVLRERLDRAGLDGVVVVESSGTSDEEHGHPIDRRAAQVLTAHGYRVPQHSARRITRADLSAADLVLAMTSAHARALRALASDASLATRVRMYRSFDPDAPVDGPEALLDVDDPWYGDTADFEITLAEVEAAADGVVEHVRQAMRRR